MLRLCSFGDPGLDILHLKAQIEVTEGLKGFFGYLVFLHVLPVLAEFASRLSPDGTKMFPGASAMDVPRFTFHRKES